MKAPEKLYVSDYGLETRYNWHPERLAANDIEYIRTDAFIEKACEFIASNMKCDGYTLQTKAKFINVFKNYMKGE